MKNPIPALLVAFALLACDSNQNSTDIFSKLSFYQPEGYSNSILVGTLEVYENREKNRGRKIKLQISITPALIRDSLKEPIFIIEGGPGVAASNQVYFYTEIDQNYRKYHDIVYLDARGTGKSQSLHCLDIQTNSSAQEYFEHPYKPEELQACIETYRDSVNFNFYRTKYMVEDLEEVRNWLGYEKINLLAISFGGKVALRYMDEYPEAVNRVVLHAPDAPNVDQLGWRGRNSQRALDLLFEKCSKDSLCNDRFPAIRMEFDSLKKRIVGGAVVVNYGPKDSTQVITLRWGPIAAKIASMLYDDYTYVQIPYIIHEAFLENYDPLLKEMGVSNNETSFFFADGLFLSIICSEDVPEAARNYQEEEENTYLGDYHFRTRQDASKIWPVEPADRSAYMPVQSDIPTLIISGLLDPILPPETGGKILEGLSQGKQVIIPHMGHMFAELSNLDCYDNYVLAYFENREANSDCFENMLPGGFKVEEK